MTHWPKWYIYIYILEHTHHFVQCKPLWRSAMCFVVVLCRENIEVKLVAQRPAIPYCARDVCARVCRANTYATYGYARAQRHQRGYMWECVEYKQTHISFHVYVLYLYNVLPSCRSSAPHNGRDGLHIYYKYYFTSLAISCSCMV